MWKQPTNSLSCFEILLHNPQKSQILKLSLSRMRASLPKMGAPSPQCEKIFPNQFLVWGIRERSSIKESASSVKEFSGLGKNSGSGRQTSDICRSGEAESVGVVNAIQPLDLREVMRRYGSLTMTLWVVLLIFHYNCLSHFATQDLKHSLCLWSPVKQQAGFRISISQQQAHTEALVIRLEESLGISNLESGPKLAGAIIARKIPNRGAIKTILQNAWALFGEAKIFYLKENLFTVVVQDEDMADQIINGGPWSVMGYCFNIHRWPSSMAIEELPLHKVAFWIQAHGIPLNLLTAGNALEIGEKLGEVIEVEDPWEKGSRGFLRMRVLVDSNNPLPQGFWLPRAEGQSTWVEFKYERLSDFCFNCGKLGHLYRNCSSNRSQLDTFEETAYGEWMKTSAIRDSRAQINTQAPRGVRRRAGQIGVVSPGVLVARVSQSGEGRSGMPLATQPPLCTNQDALEHEPITQKELHPDTRVPSDASSSHERRLAEAKGKEAATSSEINSDLQVFNWNSEGVRQVDRVGHDRVILVEENCPSHWKWPTGKVGPNPFEERLKWAKTQIAFGKHYVTDWAATGPLERRQNVDLGLTDGILNEPVFMSPFDSIPANLYQAHHREVDEAFVRMGLKRDADPGWQKNKHEIKRAKPLRVRQVPGRGPEANSRQRRTLKSPKTPQETVEPLRLTIDDFSED
ncbi:unnamed protein product [Prunus brigantina]